MKKINIAIDGHSSCGKSTIAKQVANQLGYTYIDTGAMYRAVCLFCLQNNILKDDVLNLPLLLTSLDSIHVNFKFIPDKNKSETFLNGVNVEEEIRGIWVSNNVSKISKVKEVRIKMISIQRALGKSKGVVMDGRDIGSVVFPDAELKLFITASLNVRAQRRLKEMSDVSLQEIVENLKKRDFDDSTREENPLIKADDAIVIDNTSLSKEEQYAIIMQLVNKAIN